MKDTQQHSKYKFWPKYLSVIIASGVLGVTIACFIEHFLYLNSTYPSDFGMYPMAHIFVTFPAGWVLGIILGIVLSNKIFKLPRRFLRSLGIFFLLLILSPLFMIGTYPIFTITFNLTASCMGK